MTFLEPDWFVGQLADEGDMNVTVRDSLNTIYPILFDSTLGSTGSFDASSLPNTYGHLLCVGYLRTSTAVTLESVFWRFNNNSSAVYDDQQLRAAGAIPVAAERFAATSGEIGSIVGASGGANLFGSVIAIIYNYANAVNNKVYTSLYANKIGTSTTNLRIGVYAGSYRSNLPIDRIQLQPNFVAGSRFTVYGMPQP